MKRMQFIVVVFIAFIANVACFKRLVPVSKRFVTFANKVDGITIEGNLTPLSNNLLVKVKEAASSTASGLFIPDSAKARPTEGTVVAVGPGRVHPDTAKLLETTVKVGSHVLYGKYDGTELKYNDASHQMIKDDDVLLTYTGSEATLDNVECVKDQVLIQLPPKEEKSQSGIIISTPGSQDKRSTSGIVAKVGPGRHAANGELIQPQVAAGDGVRFREFGGNLVKLGGEEFIVVRSSDILAKW